MIILNFAHPLTADHVHQVQDLTGQTVTRVIEVNSQIDPHQPLIPQVMTLIEQIKFSSADWQTLTFVINPPSLNYIAVTLLAELHGRCGYFPACLRLRSLHSSLLPRYEVAEIIDLQAVRDAARVKRDRDRLYE